jgi:hypothetical protein
MNFTKNKPPCPTCEYCEEHPNAPNCKPTVPIDTYLPLLMVLGIFLVFIKLKKYVKNK